VDDPHTTEEGTLEQQAADPAPTPAAQASSREQQRRLETLLQQLDAPSRAVIVLRDVQGYSYEEIGQMLQCRVGTVKSRLNRARLRLRALLEGAG